MIRELQSEADLIAAQNSATLTYDRPDEAWKYLRASLDAKPYIVAACLYAVDGASDLNEAKAMAACHAARLAA